MGRKKQELLSQFNKTNILSAAKTLFESKGITGTTVDDIAKEADCSKSTLYVYFKSKEEILSYLICEHMNELKILLSKCIEEIADVHECYFAICRELTSFQKRSPVMYAAMMGEIKVTEADIEAKNIVYDIYVVGEEINDIVARLIKKGIKCGAIRDDIQIFPTVVYLWAGISEIIRFANQKQFYIENQKGIKKEDYMHYAFELLLHSIER